VSYQGPMIGNYTDDSLEMNVRYSWCQEVLNSGPTTQSVLRGGFSVSRMVWAGNGNYNVWRPCLEKID